MFKKLYYPKRLRDRLNPQPEFKKHPAPVNALLWIDDTAYRLLEVSYGFTRHVDGAGRIIGDFCVTPIKAIVKPIKDHGSVALLAYSSKRRFNGKIQHFHLDGINKIQKDTIIYNAYITGYRDTNSYYEPPFERVEVLTISPLYLKVNDTIYESSMNPSKPMEMNPPGLLSRADFEEEPRLRGYHIEDEQGNRIGKGKVKSNTTIVVVINSTDAIGKTVEINLHSSKLNYKYNGVLLEDDILEIRISQNQMRVSLQTVEEEQQK